MPTAWRVRVTAAGAVSVTIALLVTFLVSLPEIAIPHLDLHEPAFGRSDGKLATRDGRGLRRRESGETDDGSG